MEIKTGELRNHLSRYLNRIKRTGEPIVVLDRNTPVAELRPYAGPASSQPAKDVWSRRQQLENALGPLDSDFELPARHTSSRKGNNPLD